MMNDFDYSVRVKNGAGWRKFNRVRLMISVGKEYHEGGKLEAVVNWINRNPSVQEVHVSVNDVLQRHNFIAAGFAEQQAYNIALFNGTAWIERNEDILLKIKAQTNITRWEDWFQKQEFQEIYKTLWGMVSVDDGVREALTFDSHALANRKIARGEDIANFDRLVGHSQNYILEELAVFAIQTRELPSAEVYPGGNLATALYLIGKTGLNKIEPLASRYFTRIDFARIKANAKGSVNADVKTDRFPMRYNKEISPGL